MLKSRRFFATLFATALLAVGAAAPASAQPVVTGGLVNVTIVDAIDLTNVNVQIPIGVAANVCGVQANVLARGGIQEPVDCTAATTQNLPVAFQP
jgi:hypothetical protein